ncbi:MAG: helix-turn-helix transcriptional regulator [Syntrophothermus sp.]|uniref:helix-turn-helix domain-containing protein n=1 Tax=Syntrophothermus sp. TaxID=2736299 RepID=UPI00257F3564|nr:helix-turn-helix transcriptional regulator [Syntrophothermus sp.]NSW84273.1 helix-turn-helix transcriptional regulator [Syntrophothermus sp.]
MEPNPDYRERREEEGVKKEIADIKAEMLATGENPLRIWRQRKGLSRRELAIISGLSYNVLNAIEVGNPKTISRQTLEKLIDVGVPGDIAGLYLRWRSRCRELLERKVAENEPCSGVWTGCPKV